MPNTPQDLTSALLPVPGGGGPRVGNELVTGRKILTYPKGTLRAAIHSLGASSALKPANIASASDLVSDRDSLAQAFSRSGAQGLQFEEVDVLVLESADVLGGDLSPATVGTAGAMPMIGEDYYVYPIGTGGGAVAAGPSPPDMAQLLDTLKGLVEALQSGRATRPAPSLAQVATAASGGVTSWGLDAVKALTSKFTGKDVRVAVIDTGIDPNHPDLQDRIADTTSFVPGESFVDVVGHGTHVAGTIAGSRSSPLAYGIAPDARLYIAKVFGARSTTVDLAAAVSWAIRNRCTVANMSLSSKDPLPMGTAFDQAFEGLAQNALQSGLLLVAASGNLSQRPTRVIPVGYPANCPSVLAVGALGQMPQNPQTLQVASFSNAGQYNVVNGQINFAGPGVNIASAFPSNITPDPSTNGFQPVPNFPNQYAFGSGTSMAAPHISGLAALMSEKLGGIGGLQLWQALALGSIDSLSTLSRTDVGFGMLLAVQS